MRVLFIAVIIVTITGVLLLGAMFTRNDNRLGMAGLAGLMTADVMAMVYAIMNQ